MSKGNRLSEKQKSIAAYTEREIFPSRLQDLMKKRQITQEDLAEAVGLSRYTVSRYCNGINVPDIKTVCMIADYFNVSVGYLLGENGYRNISDFYEYCHQHTGEPMCKLITMIFELNDKGLNKVIERVEELHTHPDYSRAEIFQEQERKREHLGELLRELYGIKPKIGQSFEDALTEYLLEQNRG